MTDSTIVALSSGNVKSALAVIRLSGKDSQKIMARIFTPKKSGAIKPCRFYLGRLQCGGVSDSAMAVFFRAPHSYTGEDMAELHIHGSMALVKSVIEGCIELGARAAQAGEFTRRAFLNGKLDLTRAEGIIDLIDSQTRAQARAAFDQSEGAVFYSISQLQDRLTDYLAQLEVVMDYPEEELPLPPQQTLLDIIAATTDLAQSFKEGRLLREGVRVVLAGLPNAGKSSLMNALLGYERAIVTDIAGTTRDTLCESYEYEGLSFVVTDTAGLNEDAHGIERMGVERAMAALQAADVILWISSEELPAPLPALEPHMERVARVISKADLLPQSEVQRLDNLYQKNAQNPLAVSAKNKHNLAKLKQLVLERSGAVIPTGETLITNSRHFSALCEALECLENARKAICEHLPYTHIAADISMAWKALGTITGVVASDEIVNRVFERFCVGK